MVLLTLFGAIFYFVEINSQKSGRQDIETWKILIGFVCMVAYPMLNFISIWLLRREIRRDDRLIDQ